MTTVLVKKNCAKCVSGAGIVTCDGCHQSFCHKHLSEHRQELLQEMNRINDECERFRQNLSQENDPAPILSAIDLWEQQSIDKIKASAENVRTNVRHMTERSLTDFNLAIDRITTKIAACREANSATEIDLNKWTDQLQALQDLLKKPFPISLMNDEKPSATVRFIKVKYDPPIAESTIAKIKSRQHVIIKHESLSTVSQQPIIVTEERFDKFAGRVTLSDDNLIATCIGYSSMCGVKQYSSGSHRIRFQIIAKKHEGIFFGIFSSMQNLTARASELPSVYGWRDFDRTILNGNAQGKVYREKNFQQGDQVSLTIDCDNALLILTHPKLKQKVQLSVDVNKCPLPWKLLVTSYGEDIICILN